jgi:hypothetical protein
MFHAVEYIAEVNAFGPTGIERLSKLLACARLNRFDRRQRDGIDVVGPTVGVASLCPRLNSNRRYRDAIPNPKSQNPKQNGSPPSEGGVAAASADGVVLFQSQPKSQIQKQESPSLPVGFLPLWHRNPKSQIPNPKSQIQMAPLLPKEGWPPLRLTGWFSSNPNPKSQIQKQESPSLPVGFLPLWHRNPKSKRLPSFRRRGGSRFG